MKRIDRQEVITHLISQQAVATQTELQNLLKDRGITVTQATLSRDIREMGLLKLTDKSGKRRYSLPTNLPKTFSPEVTSLCLRVSRAEFMVVIRTELGTADVLANLIDGDKKDDILGTVAGADTLLVICKDAQTAASYELALLGK